MKWRMYFLQLTLLVLKQNKTLVKYILDNDKWTQLLLISIPDESESKDEDEEAKLNAAVR